MKKILALILAIIMVMAMAACDGGNAKPEPPPAPEPAPAPAPEPEPPVRSAEQPGGGAPREFSFVIYNESDYDIYAIHMGPLDGAMEDDVDIIDYVLESGEDVTISGSVPGHLSSVTEWTLYVTDVDDDTSSSFDVFNPFSLSYVDIIWDYDSAGYRCQFNYGGGGVSAGPVGLDFSFTIYNESDYDIYAIHMGPLGGASEDDVDILESILESGMQVDISGTLPGDSALTTEWTLHVTDVDGDTSVSYDVFNPLELSYVDIAWDSNAGGYRCDFNY